MVLSPDRQRERLKGLMLVRIVLVTAFLGSAVAVDINTFAALSEPRNVTLIALIVVTYLATIGYGVALAKQISPRRLAYLQLLGDLAITTILTLVTGGFDSLFLFFFHLTIINAAIVSGYRAALLVAGLTAVCMTYFAAITLGWLPHPVLDTELAAVPTSSVLYEVLVNSFAGVLIALLAGRLAKRLGRATVQLRRQQTDIADLQALNENILSSISSGLLTVDRDGVIIFFNRAAAEITGLDADEVLGRPLERLFPGLAEASARHDVGDSPPRLESTFQRPDGTELFLGFSISPLQNSAEEITGRIIIFQDLSEIKELQERMQRSERMAAIGELSAAIAHEIRNPLASISGSVEMLDTEDDLSEDNRMLMEIIVREVDRLDHLIGDFLQYSQPRALETEHHELIPIIEEILQLFGAQSGEQQVEAQIRHRPPSSPVVDIDAESFRQILWNLLNNAVDALDDVQREQPEIIVDVELIGDDQLVVAVEDDGSGLNEEIEERIFDPFFTTKEEGSGLGLATTYRLLEQQQGAIETAEPTTLGGARFKITLPVVESTNSTQPSECSEARV